MLGYSNLSTSAQRAASPDASSPIKSAEEMRHMMVSMGRIQTGGKSVQKLMGQVGTMQSGQVTDVTQDISRQLAEWDCDMENLDKKQEQLLNDQWKLLRTQIGSLMGALAEMRAEVAELKGKAMTNEMQSVIEKMISAHDEHGRNHASMVERVKYLEGFIGESADKHAKDLAQALDDQGALKSTMETRLEYIEGLIGDSSDKHFKELNAAKAQFTNIHKAIEQCAKSEHHASMEDRVDYLEKIIGDSADKHDDALKRHDAHAEHQTSVETRLEYIESLIGDSAGKHTKELEAAKRKMDDLSAAIVKCAKSDHQSSLEQRLDYLEKFIGESADRHAKSLADVKQGTEAHKTSMEARLEYVEGLLGDSSDKHAKEIASAHAKLGDMQAALKSCALADHTTGMEQRLDYLEKFIGESADKFAHARELADHKKGADLHKTSMESRLQYLEKIIGDSSDKHAKEIADANSKLGDLHKAVNACAKLEHASTLEERTKYLESLIGDNADKHARELAEHKKGAESHKTTMESRLGYLEQMLGDSADKHAKEITDAKAKLGDLQAALKACAKAEHHASMEQRMEYLEKFLGESADKARKDLADHKKGADAHKTSVETRLEYLERLIGDSSDKHAKEIADAKGKMGDLHSAIKACAKVEHHESIEKRCDAYEKRLDAMDDLDAGGKLLGLSTKLQDLEALIKQCGRAEHEHASALEKRIVFLEKTLGESDSKHDEHKANMETRLEYLENLVGDSADKHAKEIKSAKDKLKDLHAAVASCAKAEHGRSLETRMEEIEANLAAWAGKSEKSMKDMELHHGRFKDLHSKVMGDCTTRDQSAGAVDERLDNLDLKLGIAGDSATKNTRDLEALQIKLREMAGKMDQSKSYQDSYKAASDQRLSHMEIIVAETAGSKVAELAREIEHRLLHVQEEQKLARDVLESSVQEQFRLEQSARDAQANQMKEQWEREMKTRQAYQENYKELLATERMAREKIEVALENRCHSCEKTITQESQRLWSAIERNYSIETEKVVEVQPTQFVAAPQFLPTLQQRVVAQPAQVVRTLARPTSAQSIPTVASTGLTVCPSSGSLGGSLSGSIRTSIRAASPPVVKEREIVEYVGNLTPTAPWVNDLQVAPPATWTNEAVVPTASLQPVVPTVAIKVTEEDSLRTGAGAAYVETVQQMARMQSSDLRRNPGNASPLRYPRRD